VDARHTVRPGLCALQVYREFAVKQCREVRFSGGGHLFAAVNGTTIHVYNTYTAENVATLRGHSGKVAALCWSRDGTRLTSAGRDGAVYEWRLSDLKREREHVLKGCQYCGVAQSSDGLTIYASGANMTLKEMEDVPNAGMQIKQEMATGDTLTTIRLSNVRCMPSSRHALPCLAACPCLALCSPVLEALDQRVAQTLAC
jgi:cilia- and flagella-associated protein 57